MQFQAVAHKGRAMYEQRAANVDGTRGLNKNWDSIRNQAYESTREPWGGVTVNAKTGRELNTKANAFALTAREPGTDSVRVHPGARPEEFHAAMDSAKEQFGHILARKDHHLGVFHDADTGTIDIDPVMVVRDRKQAEAIGAHTRNVGGAYNFKDGNGYWPPHVQGA